MMPYDGNAIAGTLEDIFGGDMTTADCTCVRCGRSGFLADMAVYLRGPGVVGRCRSCDNVLMVITQSRGMYCVDLTGLTRISSRSAPSALA